jgi:hypothetical protein
MRVNSIRQLPSAMAWDLWLNPLAPNLENNGAGSNGATKTNTCPGLRLATASSIVEHGDPPPANIGLTSKTTGSSEALPTLPFSTVVISITSGV